MKRMLMAIVVGLLACSPEETGTVTFTTWGEELIEDGIPAGEEGFTDGWSVEYDKFLVAFAGFEIADGSGKVGGSSDRRFVVDNAQPGRKTLLGLEAVEAKAWDDVSYEIAPLTAAAERVSATDDDLQLLVEHGYSMYVEGTAAREDVQKRFAWGFANGTRYQGCKAEEGGRLTSGIVVRNGSEEVVELTTHGDHLFYDRLQGSAGASIRTSLRFDAIANADTDRDGFVSAAELEAAPLDVELYDPSGLPADNLFEFLSGLARTVGHFRGEGECSIALAE
jgi:hypothetical protein